MILYSICEAAAFVLISGGGIMRIAMILTTFLLAWMVQAASGARLLGKVSASSL